MSGQAQDCAAGGVAVVLPADPGLADAALEDVGLADPDDEHAEIPAASAAQRPSTATRFADDRIPVLLPYPGRPSPAKTDIT
jgi:hypothetical protein